MVRYIIIWCMACLLVVNLGSCSSMPPIFRAAEQGDISTVKTLIEADPSLVHARESSMGASVLSAAIVSKNRDLVKYLLSKGANVNVTDKYQLTPLHYATGTTGSPEIVSLILAAGANVDALDANNVTPTYVLFAVFSKAKAPLDERLYHDLIASLDLLLTHHADPRIPNRHGLTPLHRVADCVHEKYQIEVAQKLLNAGADVNARENSNLKLTLVGAAKYFHATTLAAFLSQQGGTE